MPRSQSSPAPQLRCNLSPEPRPQGWRPLLLPALQCGPGAKRGTKLGRGRKGRGGSLPTPPPPRGGAAGSAVSLQTHAGMGQGERLPTLSKAPRKGGSFPKALQRRPARCAPLARRGGGSGGPGKAPLRGGRAAGRGEVGGSFRRGFPGPCGAAESGGCGATGARLELGGVFGPPPGSGVCTRARCILPGERSALQHPGPGASQSGVTPFVPGQRLRSDTGATEFTP